MFHDLVRQEHDHMNPYQPNNKNYIFKTKYSLNCFINIMQV